MVLHDESSYKDKKLPKGKSETEGVDTYAQPKVRSRRFHLAGMTVEEMREVIAQQYALEDAWMITNWKFVIKGGHNRT